MYSFTLDSYDVDTLDNFMTGMDIVSIMIMFNVIKIGVHVLIYIEGGGHCVFFLSEWINEI